MSSHLRPQHEVPALGLQVRRSRRAARAGGGRGDGFWLRTKLLLPRGHAGAAARHSARWVLCASAGNRAVRAHGGTGAYGAGSRATTWRRAAPWGETPLVGQGVGGARSCPVGWAPCCSAGIAPSHRPPAGRRGAGVPECVGPGGSPRMGMGAFGTLGIPPHGQGSVWDLGSAPTRAGEHTSAMHAQPCVSPPGWTHRDPALGTDHGTTSHRGCLCAFHLVWFEPGPVPSRYVG